MNRNFFIMVVVILVLLLGILFIRFFLGGNEDSWIKDARGVWIKHGSPFKTPDYVLAQEKLIVCAHSLYNQSSFETFSSQCLGSCDAYAVDLVHVPRTAEDDLEENQCEAFRRGQLKSFIELDDKGDIVRIV
jgi:hypothetical protein